MKTKRLEKVDSLIQRLFGEILQREADLPVDVLVTVSAVETVPNLRSATVWLYILPLARGEEILASLKNQMYDLQGSLNRALSMRPLPRVILKLDHGAEHSQTIEKRLAELDGGVPGDRGETPNS